MSLKLLLLLVFTLTVNCCVDHLAQRICVSVKATGRCKDLVYDKKCEYTRGDCCDDITEEARFDAHARGDCFNKFFKQARIISDDVTSEIVMTSLLRNSDDVTS